ncbi:winged helix-turn-helix transcriptional regulator [Streptomyces sp. NPDC085466]|uniref:winged helix-turn-helix transcriptional regulator n=1 Tax=Streptomyces sp. NPDC085466 TaxID=3365725 RepID=UPI0037D70111
MARIRLDEGEVCGVAAAISVVDGKWKPTLLWMLESGPHRPGELRRKVSGISEKVLTQALREMADDGLVHRETHDVLPPKTVYSLTETGLALSLLLAPLSDWGHAHLDRQTEPRAAS